MIKKFNSLNKNQKILIVIVSIIITIFILSLILFNDKKVISAVEKFNENYSEDYIVEIKGEVNRSGIYSIDKNARINDLIVLAQGLTRNADISNINLAEKISDGMILVIPSILQDQEEVNNKISLNKATKEELMTLEGIGEVRALSIIEYREKNNGFKNIEELISQNIISQNIYDKIKEYIIL